MLLEEKISHVFEAGRRGKPDEFDSALAHLIGAHFLEKWDKPRFDIRVAGAYDPDDDVYVVFVSGEVSKQILDHKVEADIARIVVEHFNSVHKTSLEQKDFKFVYALKPQSDILATNGAAGDIGNPIAVAISNSPNYLPWERFLAVELRNILDKIYQSNGQVPQQIADISGIPFFPGLRPDGKVNVNGSYYEGIFYGFDKIKISVEHDEKVDIEYVRRTLKTIVESYIKYLKDVYQRGYCQDSVTIELGNPQILINTRGAWNQGGWKIDAGSREAKPYRDGFASHGCNEDSFSGEDPTKVSGTGTFLGRNIATTLVDNHAANFVRVTLDYSIGSDDVDVNVWTAGTANQPQEEIHNWVKSNFQFGIGQTISRFGLWDPQIYRRVVTASDFFHDPNLPWNIPLGRSQPLVLEAAK